MTSEELDELEQRIQNKSDSYETSITLGLDHASDLISLARVGLAAVEKSQVPNLSDPDLVGEEYMRRFDQVRAASIKLDKSIHAYLSRKDG